MYVLREQTQSRSSGANHFTLVGRLFAVNQAKDGGLAGAVTSDQPNVLARINLQGGPTQDVLRSVRLMNI
jgi:hypothetical protein